MKNKEILSTQFIDFSLKDGILYATYKPKIITLDIAKKVVQDRLTYTDGKSFPNLVMDMGLAEIEKPARDYFSSIEASKGVSAGALVTDSVFRMTLANFFLKVTNPPVPAKMFTDKEKAIEWLQQYK